MRSFLFSLTSAALFSASAFAKTSPAFTQQPGPRISFTENKGQVHDQNYKARPDVLYGLMTGNMAVHIKTGGVSYQLYRVDRYKEIEDSKTIESRKEIDQQTIYRIDLNWLNHNPHFTKTEDGALPGYSNYYLESCPNGALHVMSYKGVTLKNLYAGVNLHYYEKNGELKHDYIVAPHADYKQIQLQVAGAELSVNKDGSILLTSPLGKVQEGAPQVYQNGKQLGARWKVTHNILSFEIKGVDPNYELIIDPITRLWGTYYGANNSEYAYTCAPDTNGNVYMSGDVSSSTVVATAGAHQTTSGGSYDALLAKFAPNGVRIWSTYYGGNGNDGGRSCAVDPNNNPILAGMSNSTNGTVIATPGCHQAANGGGTWDAFVAKFNSAGVRQWGTFYGGNDDDRLSGCTTDLNGNVYITGNAQSTFGSAIATPGSHQFSFGGNFDDAYLVKFNANGVRQWGTYYGGGGRENGISCATDAVGNVFMCGYSSTNSGFSIATALGHQPANGGTTNLNEAFLVKFNSNGVRQWGTYYGGAGSEFAGACATDLSGNVYLTGTTDPATTPSIISTPGCHQSIFGGGYLAKFDPTGLRLWATHYSGGGSGCATDPAGNVYMSGHSAITPSLVATPGSHQTTFGGGVYDSFFAKFDAGGIRQWGTFYGGSAGETANGCAVDAFGNAYMVGHVTPGTGTAVASPGSHQEIYGGGSVDCFLAKFDVCELPPAQPSAFNGPSFVCAGVAATFSTPLAYSANSFTLLAPGNASAVSNVVNITIVPVSSGVFSLIAGNACGVSPQQTLNVIVNPSPTVVVNSGIICAGQSFTIAPTGAVSYTFSGGPILSPTLTASYTVTGSNTIGCTHQVESTITVVPMPTVSVNSGTLCTGKSFTLQPTGAQIYNFSAGPVVSPLVTTSYTVIGTNTPGCIHQAVSTVTVFISPTISVNSGSICAGKSFTLSPSGAQSYTYSAGPVVSPASNSSYLVNGTSSDGCVSLNSALATVSVYPLPNPSAVSSNSVICAGEEATLTANGAFSFTFNPGGAGPAIVVTPGTTTIYTVTGASDYGCVKSSVLMQIVDECVGIKNDELRIKNSFVYIFPNPTKGIINLEMTSDNRVIILNAIGQLVYSAPLHSGTHQIELDGFARGIYFVKVGNETNSQTIKMIKE